MSQRASVDDLLIAVGIMLLGVSAWWWAGWLGLLTYTGALMLMLGMLLAHRR